MDATLQALKGHWLVRETIGYLRRTFSRLDVTSRSLFALIEEGSCFAGTLLELALACDRIYHLALPGRRGAVAEDRGRRGEFRRLSDGDRPEPARASLLRREGCARGA